jgi:hypothetical protein
VLPFLIATLALAVPSDLPSTLDRASAALLGRPYELGPLGEGTDKPLYRTDAFDCTTYIETVMAVAYCAGENGAACVKKRMNEIRYGGGTVSFAERNHIPELDWLPHNVEKGFLEDLSGAFFPGEWKTARSTIDRAAWLESKGAKGPAVPAVDLKYLPVSYFFEHAELKPADLEVLDEKLAAAKAAAAEEKDEELRVKKNFRAELEYLRATWVAKTDRLAQIPSGTILNLVRAPVKDKVKARLSTLISHQGLVLQTAKGTRLRHAAANVGHVSEQSLADYLLRFVKSGNYCGIALYRILPK